MANGLSIAQDATRAPGHSLEEERNDGTAGIIAAPIFGDRVFLNSSGLKAIVCRTSPPQTQVISYDTDSLQELGRHDFVSEITAIHSTDQYFLVTEAKASRVTVLDHALKIVGKRQFQEAIGNATNIVAGQFYVGVNRYSLPALDGPANDAGRPPPQAAKSHAGAIIDGFVMDEALRKPVWFAGHSSVPGNQAKFSSYTIAKAAGNGRRLAPMAIRATLHATDDRPWDLHLALPYVLSFEKSRSTDGKPPSHEWVRLQAVPAGTKADAPRENDILLGRIQLKLRPGIEIQRIPQGMMVATRDRCIALAGQNLLVFRFSPERTRVWGAIPKIDLNQAPVLIPGDKITDWEVKATAGRTIERIDIKQGPLTWDAATKQIHIDPRPTLQVIDDDAMLKAVYGPKLIAPTATLDQALTGIYNSSNPVSLMVQEAAGRPPRSLLWSIPVEIAALCADGSQLQLAGAFLTEIDHGRLQKAFDARQTQRMALLKPPPLNPSRRLTITFPVTGESDPGLAMEPIPMIPNAHGLMLHLLTGVVGFSLITGFFLPLSCWLLNSLTGATEPVKPMNPLVSLGITLSVGLLTTGADGVFAMLGSILLGVFKSSPLVALVFMVVCSLATRTALLCAGIVILGRIPFHRAIGITMLTGAMSLVSSFLMGGLVYWLLYSLQNTGVF